MPAGGRRLLQAADIRLRMAAGDLLQRAARGALARQQVEGLLLEGAVDRPQAVGLLGMPRAHVVAERDLVGDEKGAHDLSPRGTFAPPEQSTNNRARNRSQAP